MLYSLHEYAYYSAAPFRALAQMTRDFWGSKLNPASDTAIGRTLYASAELFSNLLNGNRSTADIMSFTTFRPEKAAENSTTRFSPQPQSIASMKVCRSSR